MQEVKEEEVKKERRGFAKRISWQKKGFLGKREEAFLADAEVTQEKERERELDVILTTEYEEEYDCNER